MPSTLMMVVLSVGPRQRLLVGAPVHALLLHVLEDALAALLAAEAAVAPAAERGRDRELLVGVDPDRARLHRAPEPPGALEVTAPDAGGQRVDAVVGLPDQLFLVVEGHRDQHRAEDLFLADAGVVGESFEDRRGVEVAAV